MKRKLLVLSISVYALLILASLTFAQAAQNTKNTPTMGGTPCYATVNFDDRPINFSQPPLVMNGAIMVSGKEMFDAMGIQVYWMDKTQELIGYRDNVFVKFKEGSTTAYINGKSVSLDVAPTLRKGTLFVPAETIIRAYELNYTLDSTFNSLSLEYRDNVYQYRKFGFKQFKKVSTTNWGISFFIPEYWERTNNGTVNFGAKNDYEYYLMTISALPLDDSFNRSIILKSQLNNFQIEYGDQFIKGETYSHKYGEFQATVQEYSLMEDDKELKGILYIFFENNIAYIFDATYDPTLASSEGAQIYDTIMSTFQISKLTVDEATEYYLELNNFFDYNMHLDEELYSNMVVDGHIPFSGTIDESTNVKGLNILISKDNQTTEYYVPIISGHYDAELPLPYSFGMHNIKVYLDLNEVQDTATLGDEVTNLTLDQQIDEEINDASQLDPKTLALEWSAINISTDDIQHLISSQYVNYDNPAVYSMANSITYNLTSDYAKARGIYDYICNHYAYSKLEFDNTISTTQDMLSQSSGNEVELSNLYAGLLRALNIPAKIMRGNIGDTSHYWVEVYINGNWIVSDLAWEIQNNDDFQKNGLKYFNLNKAGHYSQYDKIELLPF